MSRALDYGAGERLPDKIDEKTLKPGNNRCC